MKIGDVVELKSGGPAMVIKSRSEAYAVCMWYSWSRTDSIGMCEYEFPIVCLKPYVEPSKDASPTSQILGDKL